jgi:hypothetical protein
MEGLQEVYHLRHNYSRPDSQNLVNALFLIFENRDEIG